MKPPVRVLVVDDSPLAIDLLTRALEAEGDIRVVGTAANGSEATRRVAELTPSLIAMDVNMPVMNGLDAVERIMATHPTPILLLTSDPAKHAEKGGFEALSRGALDLVHKATLAEPSGQAWLRDHVRLLATVPVVYRRRNRRAPTPAAGYEPSGSGGGVGIVASTGGPPAVTQILRGLPPDFPLPILIVQHLAPGFAHHLVSWLAGETRLRICVAEHGAPLEGRTVYVAPDSVHLSVSGDRIHLDPKGEPIDGHRPSGTLLLKSLARVWRNRAVGVVLSGMGADGADGLLAIRKAGGMTIAQDQATSTVYGMPKAARDLGAAEQILPTAEIPAALSRAAARLARGTRP
jgi:two-component system, chemotaxis family, protein-glutamate methylesterase/glutaminase